MDNYDQGIDNWWWETQMEKDRFIDSIIAGKTSEQIDNFTISGQFKQHALHFARIDKLGHLAHPNNIEQEYLKSVINGDDNISLLEQELNYRNQIPAVDNTDLSSLPDYTVDDSGDYDGRDDKFIQSILNNKENWLDETNMPDSNNDSDEDISEELNTVLKNNLI